MEKFVTTVPHARGELRQGWRKGMHWVVRELRVGHMALDAMHGEATGEAAAATVLDDVAETLLAGGLTYEAPIDGFAALLQPLDHAAGAIDTRPFLVAGD